MFCIAFLYYNFLYENFIIISWIFIKINVERLNLKFIEIIRIKIEEGSKHENSYNNNGAAEWTITKGILSKREHSSTWINFILSTLRYN